MPTTPIFSPRVPYFQSIKILFCWVIPVLPCFCVPNQTQLTSQIVLSDLPLKEMSSSRILRLKTLSALIHSLWSPPPMRHQVLLLTKLTIPLLYSHCHHLTFRSRSLLRFTPLNPPKNPSGLLSSSFSFFQWIQGTILLYCYKVMVFISLIYLEKILLRVPTGCGNYKKPTSTSTWFQNYHCWLHLACQSSVLLSSNGTLYSRQTPPFICFLPCLTFTLPFPQ